MIDSNFSKDYLRSIAGILDQLDLEPIAASSRMLLQAYTERSATGCSRAPWFRRS